MTRPIDDLWRLVMETPRSETFQVSDEEFERLRRDLIDPPAEQRTAGIRALPWYQTVVLADNTITE